MLECTIWSSTNRLGTLIATEQHVRNFSGVWELALFCLVACFFEFLTSFILGAITFSFLNCFRQLLMCQMRQEEGFKFCLDTNNIGALPLEPSPECLSVWSPANLPPIYRYVCVCVCFFYILLIRVWRIPSFICSNVINMNIGIVLPLKDGGGAN
jgi:hypothetical protein